MADARQLARELADLRRQSFEPTSVLFAKQRRALEDQSRWKAYLCSRQAGKSTLDAYELLRNATVDSTGTDAVFVAKTLGQAKKIIWRDLIEMNKRASLGGVPNGTDHIITFPNGSTIQLRGVSDRADIEWFRGQRLSLAVIDEAQSIGAHLRELIWDVLRPTLMRHHGRVVLSGTVGLVAAGFWHDVATGKEHGWSVHTWHLTDNPHIPDAQAESDDFARQLGGGNLEAGRAHPKYVREIACRWVRDDSVLVYRIDPVRNTWTSLPVGKPSGVVLAGDLGTRDFSALSAIAWWDADPTLYVVDEDIVRRADGTTAVDLEDVRIALEGRISTWDPVRVVLDEGGLGLMIAETLRRRHALPVEAAQKMALGGVDGQMDMLNTDLVRGRLKFGVPSRFMDAAAALQWDPEAAKLGKRKLLGHEPDVCASLRYGWYVAQQLHVWVAPPVLTERESRYEQIRRELEEREASGIDLDGSPYDTGRAVDLALLGFGD